MKKALFSSADGRRGLTGNLEQRSNGIESISGKQFDIFIGSS
jgi:hypothetical protein